MCRIKPLLILTFLGLISSEKTKTQPNEVTGTFVQLNEPYTHSTKITPQTLTQYLYPPHIINLLQKNFLPVPIIASESAIHNEEYIQHKRHPKSVFILYPENERPPTQPCNLIITKSIPQPATVAENHKTCDHPSNEHLTTIPLPVTTQSRPTTGLTTSFTSPEATNPSSLPTSADCIQTPSTASTNKQTMTSVFPNTSTSKNRTNWTTPTRISNNEDRQTTVTTSNPDQITPTTSHTSATSTNRTSKPTHLTMYPPAIKDPAGIGERQCSFNGLFRANNFTCDQYLVCINGISYLMNCPNGLAFNDDIKSCDWPGNVVGCNPRAFENIKCPDESNKISTFRYRDSCSQFIACYRGKPRLLNCKEGFSFNENSEDCVYVKNVKNCNSIIYDFSF